VWVVRQKAKRKTTWFEKGCSPRDVKKRGEGGVSNLERESAQQDQRNNRKTMTRVKSPYNEKGRSVQKISGKKKGDVTYQENMTEEGREWE